MIDQDLICSNMSMVKLANGLLEFKPTDQS